MAKRSRTQKQRGGKRHASDWAKTVKRVYQKMKRENDDVSLGDAMKRASQLRKQGKV
jgi:hypothetical protein